MTQCTHHRDGLLSSSLIFSLIFNRSVSLIVSGHPVCWRIDVWDFPASRSRQATFCSPMQQPWPWANKVFSNMAELPPFIELPALPAGHMYSLPTAGLEYIKSIAINNLLLYQFHVNPMSLSSHYSYKSPVYFKSKFYTGFIYFFTHEISTLAPAFALFLKDEHLTETGKISNTLFDLLPSDPNDNTTKLHFMIWHANVVAL